MTMTRFARAKGSKASNERMPNEATPWHIMKQQLEDKVSSGNGQPEKARTAKQLLDEKDDPFYYDNTGNVNNVWAEFNCPEVGKSKKQTEKEKIKSDETLMPTKKQRKLEVIGLANENCSVQDLVGSNVKITSKTKSKKHKADNSLGKFAETAVESIKVEEVNDADPDNTVVSKKKSKKRKSDASTVVSADPLVEHSEKVEAANEAVSEPKNKRKKRNDKKVDSSGAEEVKESIKEKKDNESGKIAMSNEILGKMSKRQKRNQKRKNKIAANEPSSDIASRGQKVALASGGFDATGNEWSSNVNFGKQLKFEKKLNDPANGYERLEGNELKKPPNSSNGPGYNAAKRKSPKIRDDKEHKRRKPDVGSIKCTINGMDLEIVKYDGFPVKKEDAERLKELRQRMILKGIPKSEIDVAMKLERRKAEKSLARVKKQVCFHCRKAGHNLSDCPELGEGESATGICFKCGSTEHTHFECKVTKKQEYGFASCFICREQGHIAKQCPDNPKGLYPQGGSCKVCGDVTHLRKDCPDLTKVKEENAMTLNTIAESTLESLEEDVTKKVKDDDNKKTKGKVVKF